MRRFPWFRIPALILLATFVAKAGPDPTRPLRTIGAIHALPLADAALGLPAHLHGSVSFYFPLLKILFIQDRTGAVAALNRSGIKFSRGDVVDVDAQVEPGFFAPELADLKITKKGKGPFPVGRLATFAEIATGRLDSLAIQLRGKVTGTTTLIAAPTGADLLNPTDSRMAERTVPALWVNMNGNRIKLVIADWSGIDRRSLIGSAVLVRGICAGEFNSRGQLTGFILFSTDSTDVKVERSPPADPFNIPPQSIEAVLRLNVSQGSGTPKSRVQGTVTGQFSPYSVFVTDGANGLRAQLAEPLQLQEGERVDLIGTPKLGEYSPVVYDTLVRVIGRRKPVAGAVKTTREIATGRFDNSLVTVQARLLSIVRNQSKFLLALEGEGIFFDAELPVTSGNVAQKLEPGQMLEITGLCAVQMNRENGNAESFRVLLRKGTDVGIVRRANWWTVQKFWIVFAFLFSAMGLAIGWVLALRKQVRRQTAALLEQANRDGLTKLWNRNFVLERLDRELRRTGRKAAPVAVLMIDLDFFKHINDRYGHLAGDEVLIEAARRLEAVLRAGDLIGRYGGEELLAVLPDWDPDCGEQRIEALRTAICGRRFDTSSGSIPVTCSIGASWTTENGPSCVDLVRQADAALYRAKNQGRNCSVAVPLRMEIARSAIA